MNSYLALGIAITAEVIATTALKSSDSFSKLVPSVITVIGYGKDSGLRVFGSSGLF